MNTKEEPNAKRESARLYLNIPITDSLNLVTINPLRIWPTVPPTIASIPVYENDYIYWVAGLS